MSADTTTLIICIFINGRRAYLVYQVRAVEKFEDFGHLITFLTRKGIDNIRWTNSLDKALRIALYLDRECPAEYGMREFRNHIDRKIRIDNYELVIEH